jgi:hypothetical protein
MSIPTKATRNMRIIAVPLTRPIQRQPTRILTYYQFQIAHEKRPSSTPKGPTSRWIPEEGIAKWASNKAASTWVSFGKAEGGWKVRSCSSHFSGLDGNASNFQLKVFQIGERLVDRVEFEELALKSIDPSLGPKVIRGNAKSSIEDEKLHEERVQVLTFHPQQITARLISLLTFRFLLYTPLQYTPDPLLSMNCALWLQLGYPSIAKVSISGCLSHHSLRRL